VVLTNGRQGGRRMSVTPRRRFWLICALVLPIVNVPVAATFASCIAGFFVWLAVVSSQCPAGGYECPF
jgi:hypothetical protein